MITSAKNHVVADKILCYHCGDECNTDIIISDSKNFCCNGCVLVYDLLKENNLTAYYQINSNPGISGKRKSYAEQFAFLDDEKVKRKLIQFTDGKITKVTFYVPQIHCSSCVWLLENLYRINKGITHSQVNFLRREVAITYSEASVSLRGIVEALSRIGYEPSLKLDDLENKNPKPKDRTSTYRIGIAGFCFGNIMLFSFPEYFTSAEHVTGFKGIFSYLNFFLSLPVFFYCSSRFFKSALQSLRQKFLNIDVPIALGILVMFIRSGVEILSGTGAGYMDTMAGLVFFMLVGRAFQSKTYDTLSFDRNYKSFFPVSVMVRKNGKETSIPVSKLKISDRIIIRNEELIPADGLLVKGTANIDYSFVTGEAIPVSKQAGELIYAGGKQNGTALELEVVKNVSQSYLTQLWNKRDTQKRKESSIQQLVDRISHYFTIVLIAIACISLSWWTIQNDFARGMNAFTAVLIIACPCALAISSPFTLGNILRVFGRNGFYIKNYSVIERLAKVNTIVFDKTGTLTKTNASKIIFTGSVLTDDERKMVKSLVNHSSHPLSRLIYDSMEDVVPAEVNDFIEIPGKGISGEVFDVPVKIGSATFVSAAPDNELGSVKIFISVNNTIRGYYAVLNEYREGVANLVKKLKKSGYELSVVSGDHEGERSRLEKIFGQGVTVRFNQLPEDKLRFIRSMQDNGKNVMMVGDGLNDAGALMQSDAGISVSENINNFSPACDAILNAQKLQLLPAMLKISRSSRNIIFACFGIAILYNLVGLSFAVSGRLSPVIAAVLMPLSTITIILFTTGFSSLVSRFNQLRSGSQ